MAVVKRDKKQINKARQLAKMRHSCSHILAAAVKKLYKGVKLGIGPAIENGFYYDFEFPKGIKISKKDLPKIQKEMKNLIKKNQEFKKFFLPINRAIKFLEKEKQPYSVEIAQDLKKQGKKKVSFYQNGDFVNLCQGPHVKSSKEIGPFELISVAGAYWKSDEKQPMLQRIYGLCFDSHKELKQHLWQLEEAKKRDHRLLGQKLELFMFDDEVGQGLPLWLPKGAFVRHKIMEFAFNTYLERGYQPVVSPHIASESLWQHSGHLDFYRQGMYGSFGIEKENYRLKPMNCPFHVKMYQHRPRSYKELPLRWTEMGTVYRYEKSGVLHGLTRVRGFTQDDAHIMCRPDQLHDELVEALKLTLYILGAFGFKDFEMNLSIRDPKNKDKFIGSNQGWQKAEAALKKAMASVGYKKYVLDIGGAVFYGPKVDVKIADSLGRKWQLSTIQVDFNLPGRFKMRYIGKDGKEHEPFMIHRALLGSLERFMGVYIEHTAGAFPVWLSPIQVVIIPIADRHQRYGQEIKEKLSNLGIRIEIDDRSGPMQAKIHDAQLKKIPYMLIIGDQEIKSKQVAVRLREGKNLGSLSINKFIERLQRQIKNKK
jgi:threonyl-tRNA synthetase